MTYKTLVGGQICGAKNGKDEEQTPRYCELQYPTKKAWQGVKVVV